MSNHFPQMALPLGTLTHDFWLGLPVRQLAVLAHDPQEKFGTRQREHRNAASHMAQSCLSLDHLQSYDLWATI